MTDRHKTSHFIRLSILSFAVLAACSTRAQDVLRDTLTNGLQVVIVRNTIAPVVTTMMNYRVGSDEAPAGFPGMAHRNSTPTAYVVGYVLPPAPRAKFVNDLLTQDTRWQAPGGGYRVRKIGQRAAGSERLLRVPPTRLG